MSARDAEAVGVEGSSIQPLERLPRKSVKGRAAMSTRRPRSGMIVWSGPERKTPGIGEAEGGLSRVSRRPSVDIEISARSADAEPE